MINVAIQIEDNKDSKLIILMDGEQVEYKNLTYEQKVKIEKELESWSHYLYKLR
ncbi:hypothetical protein SJC03_63 [Bacteroides phage SJC03]|nr:hypothetical protein SJC03_63 [Bacteroides phage SJC03]